MKIGAIFEEEPIQWGFRGDPYLWRELKERLAEVGLPATSEKLKEIIEQAYEDATGYNISHNETIIIERFQHGGMSSGGVSPNFWKERAIPLLLARHVKP
ncbi:MAG: hypothetical protein HYS18_09310 [Burkholderiales bacterium]|nr:hypothetical protein [Burkholderiales bacterium]